MDQACVIQIVRVSGTIKKAEEEAIRRARAVIARAQRSKGDAAAATTGGAEADQDGDLDMTNGIEDNDDGAEDDDDD